MNDVESTMRVNVDVTNPGQFFACCGLLELVDRLWPGPEGWFEEPRHGVGGGSVPASGDELLHTLVPPPHA
jgi:CRISPR-associated protein Csx14